MKNRVFSMTLALSAITLAGTFASAGPTPPIKPGPVGTITPPKPVVLPGVVKVPGGFSIVPSTQLALESLTTGATTCTPAHTSTLPIQATIQVLPGQASPTKNMVDMLVNGVSQGGQAVTISTLPNSTNGYIHINRTVPLPAIGGNASVQFVLNGVQRTPLRSVQYGCITFQPQPATIAPIALPDFAIANPPFVVIGYHPPVDHPSQGFCFGGQCPLPPPDYPGWWWEIDPGHELIALDLTHTVNVSGLTQIHCPGVVDAFVTLEVYFPFKTVGSDPPRTEPVILDFRGGSRAPEPGFIAFPAGYIYDEVDMVVPCARDIPIDFTVDAANAIHESNESNNSFHMRVTTAP